MIVARLIGGLGNQMFQYAAGRALAERLGVELRLDARAFADYTLHAYGLERLAVTAGAATAEQLAAWPEWRYTLFQRLPGLAGSRWYFEPAFTFNPAWTTLGDEVLLSGYFQSEQYFAAIRPRLLAEFRPRAPLDAGNQAIADLARACDSVMIHVRRGDYVSDAKTLQVHGVCSPDYYRRAIALIHERVASPRFFVFSNDMAWARAHLPLGEDAVFVDGNGARPEVDIHLMARCRHHIIANSSFSWWGAWLAEAPDHQVVTPEPWFNAATLSARDLVPARWLKAAK